MAPREKVEKKFKTDRPSNIYYLKKCLAGYGAISMATNERKNCHTMPTKARMVFPLFLSDRKHPNDTNLSNSFVWKCFWALKKIISELWKKA